METDFEMMPLAGTPLDYSSKDNWMFFNHHDAIEHNVDTFFLYPTSVSAEVKTIVCEDIEYMKHNAHVTYYQSADTFSGFSNIYAPFYRQVSAVGIMAVPTPDGFLNTIASNVTRTDVYAALDYYFDNCNNGKPFILAGHSQGSCNLKIVLSEYMRLHPEYLERMVACYAIGFYFPQSWFDENPHVKKATGETDTGVLITWNTEGPGGTKYNLPIGNNDGFCINPLNWKTDETYADVWQNKGTVIVDGDILTDVFDFASSRKRITTRALDRLDEIPKDYVNGAADAQIDLSRGVIVTTTYDKFIPDNPIFGDRSCHFEDWSLFTINIRENAIKRTREFFITHSKFEKPDFCHNG